MENNKLHILIVDDDDRIRDLLKDYLINNNYIISTAGNAEEAKEKLKYIKFDILILDVMMPGQSGYELTAEIKKTIQVSKLERDLRSFSIALNLEGKNP